MIKIAPAAIISKYLEANSRFEGDLARTATGLMEDGYQRQLAYKLRDGSFSPFGESDRRGSTWVTALVARDEFLSRCSTSGKLPPFIHLYSRTNYNAVFYELWG